MSDIKCPFCQQELEEETFSRGRVFVSCNNPNCIISDWGGCSKQIITELIRTRKQLVTKCNQLEIAVDALKKIDWCATDYGVAQDALDKITALEQKEVK